MHSLKLKTIIYVRISCTGILVYVCVCVCVCVCVGVCVCVCVCENQYVSFLRAEYFRTLLLKLWILYQYWF